MTSIRNWLTIIRLVPIVIFISCLTNHQILAQRGGRAGSYDFMTNKAMEEKLSDLRSAYNGREYEESYQIYRNLYHSHYSNVSESDKMLILDWGIRLSFITEHWQDLDRYIYEYYSLDPYFSSSSLKESSPQLKTYISNFVRAKSERYVYVNKHKQNVDLLPASIAVYTKDDIERLGARNLLDLIRITPGFAELGDNNERIIGTRGTSSTSLQDILILINGHRISDVFTNSNAPDWISLDYVEQVELMRGPGSALYGENAFSGVINIITKDGRYRNTNSLNVDVGNGNSLRSISSPYNTYHLNYQYGRKLSNNESVFISASYYTSGGTEIDHSKEKRKTVLPDVKTIDAGNSTIYDTLRFADMNGREYINRYSPGYNLLMNYNRQALKVTSNAQSSSYVYQRPSSLNLWEYDSQDNRRLRTRKDSREFVHLEYDFFDKSDRINHDLRLKLGGDHFHKDIYFPTFSTGINGNQRVLGDEFRGTASIEFSSDSLMNRFDAIPNQHLLIGVETYVNHWHYNYFQANDSTFILAETGDFFTEDNESKFEYVGAGYFQIEQHLLPDLFIATTGVRINYHSIYSTFNEFEWGRQYSPRFALIFLAPKNKHDLHVFKAKLLYNSAFFPPPFLYRRGGIFGFEGSNSLTVQEIESGELVLGGDLTDQFSYTASAYVNKIDNIIERVYISSLERDIYINAPKALRHAGVEFEVRHLAEFTRFTVSSYANYSLATQNQFNDTKEHTYFDLFNSKNFTGGDSLAYYPGRMANFGFNLTTNGFSSNDDEMGNQKSKPRISIGSNLQWIGSSRVKSTYSYNENTELTNHDLEGIKVSTLPPALVVDARFKVCFRKFNLGASVYNLTNTIYYLPNVSFATRRQNAESRMIMFNFTYLFNVI